MGWIFVALGAFTICGAMMNWDWYMNHRRAWLFVKLFGRNGARVVYFVIGSVFVTLGVLHEMGMIDAFNRN
ncbi:MAG TPA: immunity 17 family protein [Phycisphaerae bacterium]|nr:immunity 17 family protein [Phycisphaerae bacterium]